MRLAVTFILLVAVVDGLVSLSFGRYAQPQRIESDTVEDERGLVALDQALREIENPFTIVCVAARPGDQDDGALAYARKKLGARTVMLFATRGEGEDSSRLTELDAELAVVHTREAMDAARVVGADLIFLNLRDPGYCRSADEPMSGWTHTDALRRFVRAYRSLRPDVIITRHNPKSGEGVERAVAQLAVEAFSAAANATVAPEAGFEPWQPGRLFRAAAEREADVAINLIEYDKARGRTYAQMGLAAQRRFASLGRDMDRLTPDREQSFFKLLASSSDEKLPRDAGLVDGLALPEKVARSIAPPRIAGRALITSIASGDSLVDALTERLIEKRAEGTPADLHERYGAQFVRVIRYTAAIEKALAIALGLNLEVTVSDRVVVPGQKLDARVALRNGGARAFPVVLSGPKGLGSTDKTSGTIDSEVLGLGPGRSVSKQFEYEVPKDAPLTLPASAHLDDEEYYAVGSALPGTQPNEPFGHRLLFSAEVRLGQVTIQVAALARVEVARAIEMSAIPFVAVRDWSRQRDFEFNVRVRNRTPGPLAGALWVVPLALTQDDYEPLHIAFAREDQEVIAHVKLRLPILKPPLAPDVLMEFRREKPAPPDALGSVKVAVRAIDAEIAEGLKVGYIAGSGDWLSLALTQLGVSNQTLRVEDLGSIEHGNAADVLTQSRPDCRDLSAFDALIVDEDAYFAHGDLIMQNRCLLRYVRQGGNLVVLSQKPDDLNLMVSGVQLAPYTLKLSRARLTVETARVNLLDSSSPLLSRPNKITSRDFEGWVVERARNVPSEWAPEYTALLESSDAGEEPVRGSLLAARYGDGSYSLTSLSLRRQLLAGNSGAYRLFANLLSASKTVTAAKPQ